VSECSADTARTDERFSCGHWCEWSLGRCFFGRFFGRFLGSWSGKSSCLAACWRRSGRVGKWSVVVKGGGIELRAQWTSSAGQE
jgi:hypothetical protein